MIKESEIRKMVEGIYYSSIGHQVHWEPFEHHDKEAVEEFVDNDTHYWVDFLKKKGIEIEEDE